LHNGVLGMIKDVLSFQALGSSWRTPGTAGVLLTQLEGSGILRIAAGQEISNKRRLC
jgi:hypothetical protein